MIESDQKKLWKARAATYNNLKWVNNSVLKQAVLENGRFERHHSVLDAGTGTGIIASLIAPLVKEVHGIDISPEMLSFVSNGHPNTVFKEGDVRKMTYPDARFDRVITRNVFHNILVEEDRLRATRECRRVLKKGGWLILQEGVPPHASLKRDFEKIFALKETRATFLPEELVSLLKQAGFAKVSVNIIDDKDFDLKNWLDNDGTLSEETKQKITDMHVNGSDEFKKHYNLRTLAGRVLIDAKAAIVVGEK